MPKIAVYSGAGMVIPVDQAIETTAFRCPWTREVFESKNEFVSHLKRYRTNTIHRGILRKKRNVIFKDLINQDSFEKIIAWVENNPRFFLEQGLDRDPFSREKYKKSQPDFSDFWVKITYLSVSYNQSVSNTHSCPRGERTNWGGRETYADGTPVPRGFPGWQGRIEFQINPELKWATFGSRVFDGLGINTGSGGGISENRYGYSVSFFSADWPGLEKSLIFEMLKDTPTRRFEYGTPRYFR